MIEPFHHTRAEILSQPRAWEAALEVLQAQAASLRAFFASGNYDYLLFTGCGSTYYLALSAAAVAQEVLGLAARGVPASEIWLNPHTLHTPQARSLLIAFSRSGETSETLHACQAFRALSPERHAVLTLTCYPTSALASAGHFNLALPAGQEDSIAQTRAFTTLYVGALALAALWSNRPDLWTDLGKLPAACRTLLSRYRSPAGDLGRDLAIESFYFLGAGPRYGLACELSLKMKEMTLSHSEPFHFMEFRHGPKSMVTPATLIVGLLSESSSQHELSVLAEMEGLGARVLSLGEADAQVAFGSGLSEPAQTALYLPIGQWLAFERALAKGLNPDRPTHLESVVRLA